VTPAGVATIAATKFSARSDVMSMSAGIAFLVVMSVVRMVNASNSHTGETMMITTIVNARKVGLRGIPQPKPHMVVLATYQSNIIYEIMQN